MIVFIAGVIAILLLAFVVAAPLAFFAMLFLGNIGVNLGFWALLPGAMAVKIAFATLTSNTKEK